MAESFLYILLVKTTTIHQPDIGVPPLSALGMVLGIRLGWQTFVGECGGGGRRLCLSLATAVAIYAVGEILKPGKPELETHGSITAGSVCGSHQINGFGGSAAGGCNGL